MTQGSAGLNQFPCSAPVTKHSNSDQLSKSKSDRAIFLFAYIATSATLLGALIYKNFDSIRGYYITTNHEPRLCLGDTRFNQDITGLNGEGKRLEVQGNKVKVPQKTEKNRGAVFLGEERRKE